MDVAVKKLRTKVFRRERDKLLRAFKQEIALLNNLDHPNVIRMVGICTKPKCIITEFLSCGNLRDFLANKSKQIDQQMRVKFATDIANGMFYLHSIHVLHRDLKSHNLLLDDKLNVKIGDLGISRIASNTQTMTAVGSVAWTAPEILRKEHYNEKVDVYSYGIVLWELFSGKEPYEGKGRVEAAIAVVTTGLRPPVSKDWPGDWVYLMQRCWSESPNERPSFKEILQFIADHD